MASAAEPARPRWAAIGAPLDSAGRSEGEERAPAALRQAGLLDALGATDRGDVAARIREHRRDPETGLIGYPDLLAASEQLRKAVGQVLADGERPLVLGGDCTLLIGALAGARVAEPGAAIGLAFIDGHLDFYDPHSSPTGECADTELAIVTGRGPSGLTGLAGEVPIIEPAGVIVAGYRPEPEPPSATDRPVVLERDLLDPAIEAIEAAAIDDPAALGERIERRLASGPGRFWLHLDADVLDPAAMPAVSYPERGGLSWEQTAMLIAPLGSSPALIGASVADLNSDRDPTGACAERLAALVAAALG